MSKFHSTITRRDFMKGLGLGVAGLGAAAAAAPVLHDLDEIAASTASDSASTHPWWVSKRDYFDPTVEIDWDHKWRVDGRKSREYRDESSEWYFNAYGHEAALKYKAYADEEDPNFNWEDPRRQALDASCSNRSVGLGIPRNSFLGIEPSVTPAIDGYAKWVGTEEENYNLLRGAVRYFGGDDVGVMEHDSHLDRLLCTYDMNRYKNSFENIEKPYEDQDNRVHGIPNSFKWCFSWTFRQHIDLTRVQQGGILGAYEDCNRLGIGENASVWYCYARLAIVEHRLMTFIRALGYDCVAGGMSSITSGNAIATVAGLLEHARMGQVGIHPKWGATNRGTYKMLTDFPLPPTRPIDAGIYDFCKSCEICSDACPGQIIQKGDPTWTTGRNPEDGDDGEPLPYQAQGFLGWRTDIGKCPHCPTCQGTCPFNEMPNGSWIHTFTKATIATTPLFNGFFTSMDKAFGYGRKPEADFWERFGDNPMYGIDTMR
jgi:epoxyqueuosine reductase